jgi:hypothetical protein
MTPEQMTRRQWCACLLALAVPGVLSPARQRVRLDTMFYADVRQNANGWHVERYQRMPGKVYARLGRGTYTSRAEAHRHIEWWRRAIEAKR